MSLHQGLILPGSMGLVTQGLPSWPPALWKTPELQLHDKAPLGPFHPASLSVSLCHQFSAFLLGGTC